MRILLIRHAEKPDPDRGIGGVDPQGNVDPLSLSPRGWQRAGALVCAFYASEAGTGRFPMPSRIYAARFRPGHKGSHRSAQTVAPLAEKLGLSVDLRFGLGDEQTVAQEATRASGTVLICWQHEGIAEIVLHIIGSGIDAIPAQWPADRFDLIWSCTRDAQQWTFTQIQQLLLPGDRE
jgi:broad specificity phosphatase PhoE